MNAPAGWLWEGPVASRSRASALRSWATSAMRDSRRSCESASRDKISCCFKNPSDSARMPASTTSLRGDTGGVEDGVDAGDPPGLELREGALCLISRNAHHSTTAENMYDTSL